jgi:hypothetical protein
MEEEIKIGVINLYALGELVARKSIQWNTVVRMLDEIETKNRLDNFFKDRMLKSTVWQNIKFSEDNFLINK